MARRIVIASGKGGVGKTTCTAGVGRALALKGKKVLMIDGDIGLNNLDTSLNMERKIDYDMLDVLEGRCRLKQALVSIDEAPDLYMMSSSGALTAEAVGAKSFRLLIDKLDDSFDFLLIDCPAGIERGFHRAVSAANEAIMVVTPDKSAIKDANVVLRLMSSYNLNSISLIINRVRGDLLLKGEIFEPQEIAEALKCDLIGVIKEDEKLALYSEINRLYDNKSSAGVFSVIADNLISGRRRILDAAAEYRGVAGRLKMFIKKAVS